jgi:hypothetical protein
VTYDGLTAALVAEVAKKTAVSWLRYGEATHAVWHVWHEDALCLVSGGPEQPLPDIPDGARVEVVMRSKDNGGRLVTWVGEASVVRPDEELWEPTTAVLVRDRLNLADLTTAADEWARTSVVRRIRPTGEVVESPGALTDDDHRAPPAATPATTRGPLPRVLHRRVRRRPRLS